MEIAFLILFVVFTTLKAAEVYFTYRQYKNEPEDREEQQETLVAAVKEPPPTTDKPLTEEEKRKLEERQKRWEDGVDSILSYDLSVARKARKSEVSDEQ